MRVSCLVPSAVAALTALLAAVTPPAKAATSEHFVLRSGADLVELCSTPSTDALYTAAIHYCHGFGAGVYQTLVAVTNHEKLQPLFCPPNPPITRNEAIQRFLAWAKLHPEPLKDPPADTLGRFLVDQFPCPKTAAREKAKP